MTKILVVYATDYGNTKKMAEAIASGASSVSGTQVEIKPAEDTTAGDLTGSHGIIMGTPVHMGAPHWRVKKFIDSVCSGLWLKDELVGKVGAVFTTGSGYGNAGGGCELAMLSMLNNFAELGMVILPLPKRTPGYPYGGLHWGPYGRSAGVNMEQEGVRDESLEVAEHHGANAARLTAILKDKTVFD
jgi:NAD(P)H dehydrogenase (quinone)